MTPTPDLKAAALAATTLDIETLKAAASKATPGPWHWCNTITDQPRKQGEEVSCDLRTIAEYEVKHFNDVYEIPKGILFAEQFDDENMEANVEFIALANPATILALLERLQVAEDAAKLGDIAMRFVDRAGDVHPGIDDADTICREFHAAMSDAIAP